VTQPADAGQVMITKDSHRIRCESFTGGKAFVIMGAW